MKKNIFILLFLLSFYNYAQDISLQNQFSGTVDFTMFGNTLNYFENGQFFACDIQTSSSAELLLDSNDTVLAAYLYWAGSGTGDFQVELNGNVITADRTFSDNYNDNNYFSAFANVTTQIQNSGNGIYTLSELDLTNVISDYCSFGGNFGGWAIIIIYNNDNLPDNLINVYDGMQSVPDNILIQLDNLDVVDNNNAKIGFLAWEGDAGIANNESLKINGNVISNPPLNPANNAFNGTNSFTGSSDLYNMDLDYYDIENNIQPGDTSATIEITSGQDYVMLNCIVVKLNTQLPDATCELNNYLLQNCNDRILEINFDITNTTEATTSLILGIPISVYADDILVDVFYTSEIINIGDTINMIKEITIPSDIPNDFELKIIVDDNNGNGIVFEINEDNNSSQLSISLPQIPIANLVDVQYSCEELPDIYDGISSFDTSNIQEIILGGVGEQTEMEVFYFDENGVELPSPLPNPFISKTQTVDVIVQNPINIDCTVSTTINFEVVSLPSFEINDNIYCYDAFPETTIVSIENPLDEYFYDWFDENGNIIAVNQENLEIFISGNYSVTAYSKIIPCSTTKDFFISKETVDVLIPDDLLLCDEGFSSAIFDLTSNQSQISSNDNHEISYYSSIENLHQGNNEIISASYYSNQTNPEIVYVKVLDNTTLCYNYTSFKISVEKCPPIPPQIFTPNNATNNLFTIRGLRNIFLEFDLKIYNRYGSLVYQGNNNISDWDGTYKDKKLPTGTYFYVLRLNDNYYENLKGWVYLLQ